MLYIIPMKSALLGEFIRILVGFLSLSLLGGLIALLLSIASKKLAVKKDHTIEALEEALPGLNCGSCGYAGCSGYAEALAKGDDEDITKCKPGGESLLKALGKILGKDVDTDVEPLVAALHCNGSKDVTKKDFEYRGIQDCQAARILFEGEKSCKYSCMGLGSCISVCPVEAISLDEQRGLVRVDRDLCIGCGKCVEVCPTGVLKMIPRNADYIVACNSKDKGKVTKTNCKNGCIGCMICEKKFPDSGFKVIDGLSVLDYSKGSVDRDQAALKCPVKCIISLDKS